MKKILSIFITLSILAAGILPLLPFMTPVVQADFHVDENGEFVSAFYNDPGVESTPTKNEFGLECWRGLSGGFDVGSCVALLGYYLFWTPTSWILLVAGSVFDAMAAWTIDTRLLQMQTVYTAWTAIRDIANIALIFALLYIAIATILQAGGVQLKRAVAGIIIAGLLINFSFFVTRIIIDGSNIIGDGLYQKISTSAPSTTSLGPNGFGQVQTKQISSRLVSAFEVQNFFSPEVANRWGETPGGKASLIFVFLFAAFVNLVAAYVFIKAGLLLVGRLVAFIFLIISSPIAFVASAVPGGIRGFSQSWWSMLINQALVAPVFFLFMFIITTVFTSDFLNSILGDAENLSFEGFFISTALHFAIIIVAMLFALRVTTKLSGEAGSMAVKFGGAALGGAVFGGTALVGRAVLGGAATRFAESERFKRFAANNPFAGQMTKGALDRVSGASFDLRSVEGFNDLGKARKGGYAADLKARIKAKEGLGKHIGDVKMPEYEQGPSGEMRIKRDTEGNIVYQIKTNEKGKAVPKTGREVYAEKIGKTVADEGGKPNDTAWARSSRNAAKALRKGKSDLEKFFETEEGKKLVAERAEAADTANEGSEKAEKPKRA